MKKDSALYQLTGVRMNGVMNGIVNSDGKCLPTEVKEMNTEL